MRAIAIVRPIVIAVAASLSLTLLSAVAHGQDVGSELGGGAGIFRPKNPETKKSSGKPLGSGPVTKPAGTGTRGTTRRVPAGPSVDDRIEELLEKGNTFRDARKFAEAEEAYSGVLKLRARDARGAYGLGNVYTDQQRWEDAERHYRNASQWNPFDVDALVALSVILVQPRTGADNAKRLAEAETAARRAVQIQPKNAVAWDRLGVALQMRGIYNEETEQSYRRAIEIDPEFAVAYAHLARVVRKLGKPAEAPQLYERAIALAKDAPTLNLISESLQSEQQWDNSEPVLRKALELDPRNPTSLYLLGRMLVVRKRYDEAEKALKTASEVSPKAFQPYNLLGSVYLATDRYQDAEKTYDLAAQNASAGDRPRLGGAFGFEGVGDGYIKSNLNRDALRAYQRAMELDPANKNLEQKITKARAQ